MIKKYKNFIFIKSFQLLHLFIIFFYKKFVSLFLCILTHLGQLLRSEKLLPFNKFIYNFVDIFYKYLFSICNIKFSFIYLINLNLREITLV